uniref:Uncharacterized protein LOC117348852 isoform X2 n=1 Tax=Geotrypetes seraphini TaxID=260995 RepID=A0A6P8PRE7_GEOSA|nr:uncharacterized protein LOC117348852 isoform X2 [Geotrypetes seraphini]
MSSYINRETLGGLYTPLKTQLQPPYLLFQAQWTLHSTFLLGIIVSERHSSGEVESFVSAGKNSFSTSKMSEADFLLEELGLLKMTDSTEMVDAVLKWLGENYPDVKIVDATTLQSWIQEKRDKLLLLDIRNKTEFDISHLQGGVIVDPEGDQLQELLKKSVQEARKRKADIVCYCFVGYRGSIIAQSVNKLLSAEMEQSPGHQPRVFNLEGGLIRWVTGQKPLVDDQGRPAHVIHPFDAQWGRLVEPEFKAKI